MPMGLIRQCIAEKEGRRIFCQGPIRKCVCIWSNQWQRSKFSQNGFLHETRKKRHMFPLAWRQSGTCILYQFLRSRVCKGICRASRPSSNPVFERAVATCTRCSPCPLRKFRVKKPRICSPNWFVTMHVNRCRSTCYCSTLSSNPASLTNS